jgi:hypothetical protein
MGITLANFDLGVVSRSLARGILANLHGMLPKTAFAGRLT